MLTDGSSVITAMLADGPMSGTTTNVAAVEGRPPKTIDVDGPGDTRNRYCLSDWRADRAFRGLQLSL